MESKEKYTLGPKSKENIEVIDKYSARNYAPYTFVVKKTEGPWLIDSDGNKALDFLSAYSAVLTHRNKAVIDAVKKEMEEGSDLVSRAVYSERFADFASLLTKLTGYDRVLPKSDGGSVTDTAITAMFMHAHKRGIEKPEVILTEDYFHGRPIVYATNARFDPDQYLGKGPAVPGIVVVKDDPEAIKAAINKNTIGIFIETHKGEGGPLFSTKEHFMAIRKLANENDLFFGADEIQTGLGRCGHFMAWQEYGEEARPDFVTLGKALGGGIIPVSAIVGTEKFMSAFTPGSEGSTFGGYPIACAAACASLNYIVENDIPGKSIELGNYFVEKLQGIPNVSVENRGLLIRLEIKGVKSAKPVCQEMLLGDREPRVFMKHGHYDEAKDTAYARIAPPPGAMTKELIDKAVENTIKPVLLEATRGL